MLSSEAEYNSGSEFFVRDVRLAPVLLTSACMIIAAGGAIAEVSSQNQGIAGGAGQSGQSTSSVLPGAGEMIALGQPRQIHPHLPNHGGGRSSIQGPKEWNSDPDRGLPEAGEEGCAEGRSPDAPQDGLEEGGDGGNGSAYFGRERLLSHQAAEVNRARRLAEKAWSLFRSLRSSRDRAVPERIRQRAIIYSRRYVRLRAAYRSSLAKLACR